jgi:hypothetical protein
MNRRHFIVLVIAGVAILPLGAQAQQSDKVWRIGFIAHKHERFYEPLFEHLRELGYEEGRNLIVERRYAQGQADRFQEFADEMVRSNVDVIIVITTPAAQAAKRATTTIPIVHPAVIDPVGTGLVASLARPGGNLTGLAIPDAELSAGLPGQSLGYKFHLPYRMGRLRINMSEPIEPEELLGISSHAQRRRVLDAINVMAPPAGEYAGRANFALTKRCLRRHVETGSSSLKCFLLEALEMMPDPSHETELLRYFIRYGVLPTGGVADMEWFARQAMWISDGRGLKTVSLREEA